MIINLSCLKDILWLDQKYLGLHLTCLSLQNFQTHPSSKLVGKGGGWKKNLAKRTFLIVSPNGDGPTLSHSIFTTICGIYTFLLLEHFHLLQSGGLEMSLGNYNIFLNGYLLYLVLVGMMNAVGRW